jgi:predicted nucleic acid-binding protein
MSNPKRLLFVDTNIWLDFYRARTDAGLALLEHLDVIRDKVIMTYQVEMEFKKHRQEAILEGFNAMKAPAGVPRPGLFADAKTAKALKRDLGNAEKRIATLKRRLRRAIEKPTLYDPVYKICQRCFHKADAITLTREMKVRVQIRRRAFRRFLLGYPPRKKGDTSIQRC